MNEQINTAPEARGLRHSLAVLGELTLALLGDSLFMIGRFPTNLMSYVTEETLTREGKVVWTGDLRLPLVGPYSVARVEIPVSDTPGAKPTTARIVAPKQDLGLKVGEQVTVAFSHGLPTIQQDT